MYNESSALFANTAVCTDKAFSCRASWVLHISGQSRAARIRHETRNLGCGRAAHNTTKGTRPGCVLWLRTCFLCSAAQGIFERAFVVIPPHKITHKNSSSFSWIVCADVSPPPPLCLAKIQASWARTSLRLWSVERSTAVRGPALVFTPSSWRLNSCMYSLFVSAVMKRSTMHVGTISTHKCN